MTAARAVPVLAAVGLLALLGLGIWLILRTPGSLVNEEPPRLGATPEDAGEAIVVVIEDGEGADEISDKLEEAGVIASGRLFRTLASLMGVSDDLIAGEYEFEAGETALSAVQRISRGITSALVVTVPEGWRSEEIGELLERRGVVTAAEFERALDGVYSASFLERLPPGPGLEGVLFPATYGFSREATAHDAVQQMLDAFDQRYRESVLPEIAGGRSLFEVVIIASIVEREAQVAEERPVIAGIFYNRLELGIPLQADPTVQYALTSARPNVDDYWPPLSAADLAIDSPYNTYQNVGLPPGPIANPGLDSLLAAANPADTSFLFLVACEDGSGRHVFAETLDEHNLNVSTVSSGECPA